jgi:hypothetical protein
MWVARGRRGAISLRNGPAGLSAEGAGVFPGRSSSRAWSVAGARCSRAARFRVDAFPNGTWGAIGSRPLNLWSHALNTNLIFNSNKTAAKLAKSNAFVAELLCAGQRILLNRFKVICPVQSHRKKFIAMPVGQIISTSWRVQSRTRGVSRSSRTRDGMRWTRQRRARDGIAGQASACERSTGGRTNGASTPSPKLRRAAHGRSERLAEVAAYGEVVWSWHPLLMSSWRRCVSPTGLRQPFNPSTTVTKRNSSPGRARRKPLKPLCRECRLNPVNLW